MVERILAQQIGLGGVVLVVESLIPRNGIDTRRHGREDDRYLPVALIVELPATWYDGADESYARVGVACEPPGHLMDKRYAS